MEDPKVASSSSQLILNDLRYPTATVVGSQTE